MENSVKPTFMKTAINYALIMAAVSIFISLVYYFTDLYLKTWSQFVSLGISIIVLAYLMIVYRKTVLGGYASFGQIFSMGFVSSLISLVIAVAFSYLMMNVLFPEMKEALLLNAEQKILDNPKIPEAYVDTALERAEKILQPGKQVLVGLIGGTIFNSLICLIVAAFVKKEEPIVPV